MRMDDAGIVRKDIEHRIEVSFQDRKRQIGESGQSLIEFFRESARFWIERGDKCQAGRWRRDRHNSEIGPIVLKTENRFPNVARVELRLALSSLSWFIQRESIVKQDDGTRPATRFKIDEVLEGLLEEMQAVDETHRQRMIL